MALFGQYNPAGGLFAQPQNQPAQGGLFSLNQPAQQNQPTGNLFSQPQQQQQGGNLFQTQQQGNLFQQNTQSIWPAGQNTQQQQPLMTMQQAQQQQQQQQQIEQLGNLIALTHGCESSKNFKLETFKSANQQQMIQLYFSKFNMQFGNSYQNKLVKELNNQQYIDKMCEFQLSIDENINQKKNIEIFQDEIKKQSVQIKNNIQKLSQQIIALKTTQDQLKNQIHEISSDIELYNKIQSDFYHFCNFIRQGLSFPPIQVPSPFLSIVAEKINASIQSLRQKVEQIQDLFESSFNKDNTDQEVPIQFQDYDLALSILQETMQYFHIVCSKAFRFKNHFDQFKRAKMDFFKQQSLSDIQEGPIQKTEDQNTKILRNIIQHVEEKRAKILSAK